MSADRLDEIKARAEQVHWTSTSIEQAMARMASSAADVPWLVAEVERLTRVIDAKPRQPLVVLNEYLDRAEKAETEVERLTDLCDEFRMREESQDRIRQRLTAEVERLRGWIDRSERQEARARRAEAEVERLTAERDALAAQVAQVEALGEKWLATDEAIADYFSRERLEPTLVARVATVRQEQLQAALADTEADTSDTQTTDQKDQS